MRNQHRPAMDTIEKSQNPDQETTHGEIVVKFDSESDIVSAHSSLKFQKRRK